MREADSGHGTTLIAHSTPHPPDKHAETAIRRSYERLKEAEGQH